jgi:NADH-quinone oxidoreductase subunit H
VIFLVAGFAETNRPPFDLPEADAELVAATAPSTAAAASPLLRRRVPEHHRRLGAPATLFLGGWNVPVRRPADWVGPDRRARQDAVLVFFFIWVRATLPRLRYDQLMSLGWKVFLPLATLNALVTAILVVAA